MRAIKENIYGHKKRLDWIVKQLRPADKIVEIGCGTGYMITLPLIKAGYFVTGIDTDERSIAYGRNLFSRDGVDPNTLQTVNLFEMDIVLDIIIVSEVLEHIPTDDLNNFIALIFTKLKLGGRLLITVPNGYGWFELEFFLWYKAGIGRLIASLGLDIFLKRIKFFVFGNDAEDMTPSTLANSPHVQRFSYNSIQDLLKRNGFTVTSKTGSVLFCGPFSNLFFTGINPIMKLNAFLGRLFPRVSSAFYIAARKQS